MSNENRETERIGEYDIQRPPGGGFTAFNGPGIFRDRGQYVASPGRILEKLEREGESTGVLAQIGWCGILNGGKRSIVAGRTYLGLDALQKGHPGVGADEIINAFRTHYNGGDVDRFMDYDPKVRLDNLTTFRKARPANERAFHSISRSTSHGVGKDVRSWLKLAFPSHDKY